MKKSLTTVLVAFGLFLNVFLTSSAMAGTIGVGIIGAGANFNTTGSEIEQNHESFTGTKEITSAEKSESGIYGSIFAEYTFGSQDYGMTVGVSYTPMKTVLGSGSRSDTVSDSDETSTDTGTYTAKAKVSNQTSIYIEPMFMPTDNFGLYLKGGIARVTVNSLEKIDVGTDSSVYGDETINGLMFGLGVKGLFDNGMFYKLEAIRINYDTVSLTSSTGNKNKIEADPQQTAGRFAIGYRF